MEDSITGIWKCEIQGNEGSFIGDIINSKHHHSFMDSKEKGNKNDLFFSNWHKKKNENNNNNNNNNINAKLEKKSDLYLLAKYYIDLRDHGRAFDVLKTELKYCFFLRNYSRFLMGEKRKEELMDESNSDIDKQKVMNEELSIILNDEILKTKNMDSFGYFLCGMIYRELSRDNDAIESFINSIHLYSYNWSVWRSFAEMIENENIYKSVLSELNLNHNHNNNIFYHLFMAQVMIETTEFYDANNIVLYFNDLCNKLPENTHILGQTALALYNMRSLEESEQMFKDLISIDPNRIDLLHVYSNVLYVKEKRKNYHF